MSLLISMLRLFGVCRNINIVEFGSIIVSLGFIAACYMIYPSITTKMVYKQLIMEKWDDDRFD